MCIYIITYNMCIYLCIYMYIYIYIRMQCIPAQYM